MGLQVVSSSVLSFDVFLIRFALSGLKNGRDNNAKTLNKILNFYKMVIISKNYQKEIHNENGYSQK